MSRATYTRHQGHTHTHTKKQQENTKETASILNFMISTQDYGDFC